MRGAEWIESTILFAAGIICWMYALRVGKRIKLAHVITADKHKETLAALQSDERDEVLQSLRLKKRRKLALAAAAAAIWIGLTILITALFGPSHKELEVSIFVDHVNILGIPVSQSVFYTWFIIAGVAVLGLLFRYIVVPRFQDVPKGVQNVVEFCVETVGQYTEQQSGIKSSALNCCIFTIAILMIGSALIEILGVRSPTSDLVMTGSMAVVSFILINYFSIKKKGVLGRLKSMAEPSPIIFPIELISAVAKPVSLACRLFGNMIGGMIVIDLLYVALGNAAVGAPAVLGLYFNVFHPLIQAYIFITLTLTFVREAAE